MRTFNLEEVKELLKEYDEQNVPLKLWLEDKGLISIEDRLKRIENKLGL